MAIQKEGNDDKDMDDIMYWLYLSHQNLFS